MTKQIFLKHLKVVSKGDNDNLPSYYSEQVVRAIDAKVFMPDELQSVIRAECFALNGELMHNEVNECFNRLKSSIVL